MRTTTTLLASGAAVLLLLGAAACSSSDSDDATKASPTTQSADGESSDGGSSSGDDSSTDEASTAAATLPDGWPDEIALPDDTTLVESAELSDTSWMVIARIDGDVEGAYDAMLGQLTDAGYEIVGTVFTPTDEGGFGSISARGDEYTAAVSFGPDATGDTHQVTVNVAAVETAG